MDIFALLEFNEIIAKVKDLTKTELGGEYASGITCFKSEEEATYALNLVSEADSILTRFGSLPLAPSHKLAPLLDEAKRGNILTPHDFYLISADVLNIVKVNYYLKDKLDQAPLLKVMLSRENDLSELAKEIDKIITPNLLIKDNASHELARIRKNIMLSEDRLNKAAQGLISKYGSYLAESVITKRDGHFVIPIKTAYKNKVDGIIYDISNSGQTIFIEPAEIVALNSTLISYQNDELIEINRLLRELTLKTLHYEDEIINNNVLLAELDLIFAKATYGQKIKGFVPIFHKAKGLKFTKARHPLIDPELVVANTFNLRDDQFIIVISGPNAGGKTVALKTIGLLVLMAKSGLMLSVSEEPHLYFYNDVYASIGDEQSLSQNLSTFSSHVKRIGEIMRDANSDDLVLLDELATGTSPEEGEALALAIVSYLLNNHISSVISSHYSRLKEFAYKHDGIINASMAFDEKKLTPRYEYHEDVPGRSYGLVVAKRFGINEAVINEAEAFLSHGVYDFESTIGKLREEIRVLEEERAILAKKRHELAKKESELDKKLKRQSELEESFKSEKHERLEKEINEAIETLDSLVKSALSSGAKAHEIIELRQQIKDLGQTAQNETKTKVESLAIGDYVEVKKLHVKGEITRIKGDEYTVTLASGKILKVKGSDLDIAVRSTKKKEPTITVKGLNEDLSSVKPEINVIGMRVDEAISVLGPYLDRALLKRYPSVRIIHGFGTGALRRAIHDYLARLSFVKSYALAGEYEGQGGATIVTF
ncbi:MAG: Endonuclease MutS2 [Tenericutes bacterium ADurb.Bin239]|nr:MAG: Endonuclease MutS2 [Tenericutes bacterium ADurb.Bin239]